MLFFIFLFDLTYFNICLLNISNIEITKTIIMIFLHSKSTIKYVYSKVYRNVIYEDNKIC